MTNASTSFTPAATTREDIVALLPQLRSFARTLVGPGRADRADDLVQDTVMQALAAWGQFTPGTNLKAWLFRILHNRFLSVARRKSATSEVPSEHLESLAFVPATQHSRLETLAFKAAFVQLRLEHREVLVLSGVHGLPYEQVAEICGCAVGTVKSRVFRARAELKAMLLGEEEAHPPLVERPAQRPRLSPQRRPRACRPSAAAVASR